MARTEYADVVLDQVTANPISGAQVLVKTVDADGIQGGDATIYVSETGVTKANPFLTGSDGYYSFWATTQARYNIIISATAFTTRTIRWDNNFISPSQIVPSMLSPAVGVVPAGLGPLPWPFASAPTGWLLCAGQQVNRTTYADLHAIVAAALYAAPFGAGNGTTTFTLPDMRGRYIAGLDNMNGTAANVITRAQAAALGGTSGVENHLLTIPQMPLHGHGGAGGISANHSHGLPGDTLFFGGAPTRQAGADYGGGFTLPSPATNDAYISLVVPETGGATAHENIPPTMFLNYIVKY